MGYISMFYYTYSKLINLLLGIDGPCATFYEHYGLHEWKGWLETVQQGEGNFEHRNDQVSSVKVKLGCMLKVYRDYDFEELLFSTRKNILELPPEHNDKMSSYRCFCSKYFY